MMRYLSKCFSVAGRSAPVLSCQSKSEWAGVLFPDHEPPRTRELINLIAVSAGFLSLSTLQPERYFHLSDDLDIGKLEPDFDAYLDPDRSKGLHEIYDALWIEFDDGLAYRKGLARVRKGICERETLGWIDVTIG